MTGSVLVAAEQLRRRVPGGIGRYAAGLVGGLVAEAADGGAVPPVTLYASRPPAAGGNRLAASGLPVVTSALPSVLLTRAWDRGLVVAPGGFDVVHAVSLAAPPVRRRPSPGGNRPARPALVVTVHDVAWRAFPESTTARGRRWHEAALARALRLADALVVPSAAVAADLRAAGAPPGAVRVLPWGADHLPPPDRAGAAALLRRLGIEGGYLLTASTLEPRKNLGRLAAAYAAARSSFPEPWPLVVVGPTGWGESGLGAPPDGVVAAGPATDAVLAGLYAEARAFAYVPLTEGFGLPPVEAMAFGTPVVASTGVPSVDPAGGEAGGARVEEPPALRVDPRSVDDVAGALVAAAVDGDVRRSLAIRGPSWVRPMTWRRSARAHAELWASLR